MGGVLTLEMRGTLFTPHRSGANLEKRIRVRYRRRAPSRLRGTICGSALQREWEQSFYRPCNLATGVGRCVSVDSAIPNPPTHFSPASGQETHRQSP